MNNDNMENQCLLPAIRSLPDTVLLKVFSYLPEEHVCKAARVCKAWKRVAYDSSLWECVDLRPFYTNLDDEIRITRLERSPMIPLLQNLNLGGMTVSPRVFQILAKECPKLKVLCLKSVTFLENFNATENCFPVGLTALDLRRSSGDDGAFRVIAQNIRSVENLGLSDQYLTSLIASNELKAMFPRLSNIRILEFSYCVSLNDVMMSKIALYCKSLCSLYLQNCTNFSGDSLSVLMESCPLLSSLVLYGTCITDSSLRAVDWRESSLTELDLSYSEHLSHEGLKAMLPQLTKLRYLRLSSVGRRCDAVTDDLLYKMAENPNDALEILDLSYSKSVSEDCIRCFADQHGGLLYLRVHHCKRITRMFLSPDSEVFIDANFPVNNKGMVSKSKLLKRYTYCSPIRMRDWSLDQQMGWR